MNILPKKLIIIVGIVFIILLIFFLLILNSRSKNPLPIPVPIFNPSNSQSSIGISQDLIITELPENNETVGVAQYLEIKFNKPLAQGGLELTLEPEQEYQIEMDESFTTLNIKPYGTWKHNTTYTVTISKNTRSADGKTLGKDYQFTFKIPPYSGI